MKQVIVPLIVILTIAIFSFWAGRIAEAQSPEPISNYKVISTRCDDCIIQIKEAPLGITGMRITVGKESVINPVGAAFTFMPIYDEGMVIEKVIERTTYEYIIAWPEVPIPPGVDIDAVSFDGPNQDVIAIFVDDNAAGILIEEP